MSTKSPTKEPERTRLGIAAVERRTGNHRTTIWRRQKRGDFPACHYIGERRMWWLDEIEQWEREQMERPPEARRGARNLQPPRAA